MSRTTTLFDTISLDSKRTIYGMVRPIDLYVLCRVSYSMRISVLHIYPDYNLKYFMNISIKLEELCELPVYITGVLLLYALKGYRVNFMNDDNLEMITIVNLTGDTPAFARENLTDPGYTMVGRYNKNRVYRSKYVYTLNEYSVANVISLASFVTTHVSTVKYFLSGLDRFQFFNNFWDGNSKLYVQDVEAVQHMPVRRGDYSKTKHCIY